MQATVQLQVLSGRVSLYQRCPAHLVLASPVFQRQEGECGVRTCRVYAGYVLALFQLVDQQLFAQLQLVTQLAKRELLQLSFKQV